MPISHGDKVLVSGANGFLAIWVVSKFLDKGYSVRGTVRSADKAKYLQDLFKSFGNKFEIAIVPDITKEGAFDEAIKGVDGIAHTASPFNTDAPTVHELVDPAVNGTLSMLKSAAKARHVKRIVVTSSCASILESGVIKEYSEKDWNELAIKEINEQGDNASGTTKYLASKTLAEKAAWEFYNKNKSELSWDLSVVNPPYIYGPTIHDIKSLDALNTSSRLWYDHVLVSQSKEALSQGTAWVDVRDVAEAHTLALEKPAAGGERIIISTGSYIWQDWLDAANSLSPSPIPSHPNLPVGFPGLGATAPKPLSYDTSKEARILGIKFFSKADSTRDILADFEKRGWRGT